MHNPGEGKIITVQDFVDMLVYYLMQPEPDYTSKITIVCSDGFRMNVFKDQIMGQNRESYQYLMYSIDGSLNASGVSSTWQKKAADMRENNGADWNGTILKFYTGRTSDSAIVKIIDPADNTTFGGVSKHTITANIPTPGQLISLTDVINVLNTTNTTVYEATDVYVYDWTSYNWTNSGHFNPCYWQAPGGPGWAVLNKWQYTRLDNPKTYGSQYNALPANLKLTERQYIASDQLQTIASTMYANTINKKKNSKVMHVLSCHINCHNSCHCARW